MFYIFQSILICRLNLNILSLYPTTFPVKQNKALINGLQEDADPAAGGGAGGGQDEGGQGGPGPRQLPGALLLRIGQ